MNLTAEKTLTQQSVTFPYTSFDDLPLFDQRYLPRWQTEKRAYYRNNETNLIIKTQVKDLSFTGACLYTYPDVNTNQNIELIIYLAPKISFLTRGTVVWKRSLKDVCHVGVMFDPLSSKNQELILKYAFGVSQMSLCEVQ